MKFKKGFSLAEILIAVIFLGVVATLTIPNTMASMDRRHKVTTYKIAYNTVSQVVATLMSENKALCQSGATTECIHSILRELNKTVGPQGYICEGSSNKRLYADNKIFGLNDIKYKATWTSNSISSIRNESSTDSYGSSTVLGPDSITGDKACTKTSGSSPWILAKTNISYVVDACPSCGQTCKSVLEINASSSEDEAYKNACGTVYIDYNGLDKGPNRYARDNNTNARYGKGAITDETFGDILDSTDRFVIYIGSDGVTAGPPGDTVSGRLFHASKTN